MRLTEVSSEEKKTTVSNLMRRLAGLPEEMSPEEEAEHEWQQECRRLQAERAAKRLHVQSKDELVIGGLYISDHDDFLLILGKEVVEEEGEHFFYVSVTGRYVPLGSPSIQGNLDHGGRLHYIVDDETKYLGRENYKHWCKLSRIA